MSLKPTSIGSKECQWCVLWPGYHSDLCIALYRGPLQTAEFEVLIWEPGKLRDTHPLYTNSWPKLGRAFCSWIRLCLTSLPNWSLPNWVWRCRLPSPLGQLWISNIWSSYFAMFVASLASQKLLFSVLETMWGLFCFVRCSVFRFCQPNYQSALGKLMVITKQVSKADCWTTCSWQVAVLG